MEEDDMAKSRVGNTLVQERERERERDEPMGEEGGCKPEELILSSGKEFKDFSYMHAS